MELVIGGVIIAGIVYFVISKRKNKKATGTGSGGGKNNGSNTQLK